MLRLVVGVLLAIWLLGLLLSVLHIVGALVGSLFHIILIIAVVAFIIDLLGGRRRV